MKRQMIKAMVDAFKKEYPEVSLRQLSSLNGYNENYIACSTCGERNATKYLFENIEALLNEARKNPLKYERKQREYRNEQN